MVATIATEIGLELARARDQKVGPADTSGNCRTTRVASHPLVVAVDVVGRARWARAEAEAWPGRCITAKDQDARSPVLGH